MDFNTWADEMFAGAEAAAQPDAEVWGAEGEGGEEKAGVEEEGGGGGGGSSSALAASSVR